MKMNKSLLYILYFLFTLYSYCLSMNFSFKMNRLSMQCIAEYFTPNTLSIFTITSNSNDIRVRLFDPNGNAVYNKENTNMIKLTYTSTESGNHQLCIDNYGSNNVIISFEFLSGVLAKDYSDVAKKENMKPIELDLMKLEDMMKYLVHEFSSIMSSERKNHELSDTISNTVVFFSIIVIFLMGLIGTTEVFYLRKYFQKRKLI